MQNRLLPYSAIHSCFTRGYFFVAAVELVYLSGVFFYVCPWGEAVIGIFWGEGGGWWLGRGLSEWGFGVVS